MFAPIVDIRLFDAVAINTDFLNILQALIFLEALWKSTLYAKWWFFLLRKSFDVGNNDFKGLQ